MGAQVVAQNVIWFFPHRSSAQFIPYLHQERLQTIPGRIKHGTPVLPGSHSCDGTHNTSCATMSGPLASPRSTLAILRVDTQATSLRVDGSVGIKHGLHPRAAACWESQPKQGTSCRTRGISSSPLLSALQALRGVAAARDRHRSPA